MIEGTRIGMIDRIVKMLGDIPPGWKIAGICVLLLSGVGWVLRYRTTDPEFCQDMVLNWERSSCRHDDHRLEVEQGVGVCRCPRR